MGEDVFKDDIVSADFETFTVVAMIYIVLTVLASGSLALVGRLAFRVKAKVF